MKLTERQADLLSILAEIEGKPSRNSRNLTSEIFPEEARGLWATPQDFGGTDGSHHSATATQLAKKGLVDRYKGGRINFFQSRSKGSCLYRINEAGRAFLAARTKEST